MILMANVLLRPLAEWIAGRPTAVDEGTKYYLLSVTCKSRQEAKARALILEMVTEHPFTVRSLHSVGTNDPTKTEVKAELGCTQVGDGFLEEIVRRLSLEPSVSAVSWERLTAEQVDT
jgi:putative Mg2+ transporter-C (MgtC) family protein